MLTVSCVIIRAVTTHFSENIPTFQLTLERLEDDDDDDEPLPLVRRDI